MEIPNLNLTKEFINALREAYGEGLVSVILYGSAARGEFFSKYSDVNLLVALNDTALPSLKKASALVNKWKFRRFNVLFFTEDHIKTSLDVFPIEFLDMKESHVVLYGKDILKDVQIDTKNLRFQCEQELKEKLLNIKSQYLRNTSRSALKDILFASFSSVSVILKSAIKIKPDLKFDPAVSGKIKEAKAGKIKLSNKDLELLFAEFVEELEKVVSIVDKI